jgi:hypothetical protein
MLFQPSSAGAKFLVVEKEDCYCSLSSAGAAFSTSELNEWLLTVVKMEM